MCDTEPILTAYQMGVINQQETYSDLIGLGVSPKAAMRLLDRGDAAARPEGLWSWLWRIMRGSHST